MSHTCKQKEKNKFDSSQAFNSNWFRGNTKIGKHVKYSRQKQLNLEYAKFYRRNDPVSSINGKYEKEKREKELL